MVQPDSSAFRVEERPVTPSPGPQPDRAPAAAYRTTFSGVLRNQSRDKTKLFRILPGWQIFMIGIGGVLGVTIFSTNGEIMNIAGPVGLLVSLVVVALTTISVMECLGDLLIMWPVSNAMVEYVRHFVDRDLAIVVGIAYWYTMSSVFATLIIVAANFSSYWVHQEVWRAIIFYFAVPVSLLGINCLGVQYYGFIEGIGGFVKLAMVASGVIFMIADAVKVGSRNIDDSFQHNESQSGNNITAICISIPLIAYGFIGVEIVSVTAFEARDRGTVRTPVRCIAYVISGIYLICGLLEAVIVNWLDPSLPSLWRKGPKPEYGPGFFAVIVIAARQYGTPALGWYFTACIIYFCLSAANTALYVASRTLFGLTRGINQMDQPPFYLKPFKFFGTTTPLAQVPHWALIFSTFAFFWLPYLELKKGYSITDLLAIMSTTASIGAILVWTSQCLAFICYYHWFHKYKHDLPEEYNRWNPQPDKWAWQKSRMLLASTQPIPAYVGLCGCLTIVFVLTSATWWHSERTFKKIATAYASPVILSALFWLFKAINRRLWVRHGDISNVYTVISYFQKSLLLQYDNRPVAETEMSQHRDN